MTGSVMRTLQVLSLIFQAVAVQVFEFPPLARRVCGRWRHVIDTSPAVWAHISFASGDADQRRDRADTFMRLARNYITNSKDCDLFVDLDLVHLEWQTIMELLGVFKGHTRRIKVLQLRITESWMLSLVPRSLGPDCSTDIARLSVLVSFPASIPVAIPPSLLRGTMANMTHLLVCNVSLGAADVSFPRLRTFEYANASENHNSHQQAHPALITDFRLFLDILSTAKALQELKLQRPSLAIDVTSILPNSRHRSVVLHHLRKLVFMDVDSCVIRAFLEHVHAPALRRLSFRLFSRHRQDLWWFPSRVLLPAQELNVAGYLVHSSCEVHAFMHMLAVLPSMTNLSMEDTFHGPPYSSMLFDVLADHPRIVSRIADLHLLHVGNVLGPEIVRFAKSRSLNRLRIEHCHHFKQEYVSLLEALVPIIEHIPSPPCD